MCDCKCSVANSIPFSYLYALFSRALLFGLLWICSAAQAHRSSWTRPSKSSSHICSVNTDSIKTKRKAQGLKKKKEKKVKNLCLSWYLCSPEGVAHSLQRETMNFFFLKRCFFASSMKMFHFMKMHHFHERMRILYITVSNCEKSCYAPCSAVRTAGWRTRLELVGMQWAALCLNWGLSPKHPAIFSLFLRSWTQ